MDAEQPLNVNWAKYPENLAVCGCGGEFIARIYLVSFGKMLTDRDCPKCGQRDKVHEVVWNNWLSRTLHRLGF